MKKLVFSSLAALTLLMSSCGDSEISEVKFTTKKDSLSYAIGMFISDGVKKDTTLLKDLNIEMLKAAIEDVLVKDGEEAFSLEEAQKVYQSYQEEQVAKQLEEAKKSSGAQTEFLEQNKTKEGVQVTQSGLQYRVISEGEGPKPLATDVVKVHYHGTLIDGTVFDSSVDRGQPATFGVTQVIPGWVEALQLMPVGSKYELVIPSELAYGERGAGGAIKPYSTLIFEVELLEIVTPDTSAE